MAESDGHRVSLEAIKEPVDHLYESLDDYFRRYLRTDVGVIDRIFEHLLDSGGKRFRPLLAILISSFSDTASEEDIFRLAVSVEFIHTATLLHDDIVDQSDVRRGNRVAYQLWGAEPSVLSGDYLYSRAFSLLSEIGHISILREISTATTAMARGEVLQLLRSFSPATSTEEYFQVIEGKTASLISATCASAGILAGFGDEAVRSLRRFGTHLGFSFQIIDDLLDYTAELGDLGKVIGKDFLEGKVTLPAILLMDTLKGEARKMVSDVFLSENPDPDDFHRILSMMEDRDIINRTQGMAEDYSRKAVEELRKLPDGAILDSLAGLVGYVTRRRT
ncbi:MAG TPA: polyprenyl synthetase family protein [Proteobacteria bacterium]|nr:all-trans-nonaprenyl-diphosphate synthase [bacterium BMS3Abin14]HDL53083.1 polyprenyl synthetase family protein [Pseudomonadota bacterium]